ncbi:HTH CENPB-type domain-containing protein [Schizosaccharomyces pombe]|uniref:ARS-binding protein 1 n=1 Tax=Schizosaccharomyces pombe (strain 972 / ATCC 24843) TaxID=284812 RepID=ABP1_SCHPO|nr:ARS-binding protein 1 [Schizosaccharomyces pombe]P49777.2 RecName: Full=ARS-binding protein 1 [Schizosaccharomyces pombe 972h-]CAB50967.1 CENP-B homolog [Schizosaccharomyces pombe]|eukprot:NP_596460.1 ARS-binding protein 1 [Schizosaccharomyces pombe]
MGKIKRRAITEHEKRALRHYFFQLQNRSGQQDLIEWFREKFGKDISQPSVSQILSSKYSYLDNTVEKPWDVKRNRPPKYPLLEAALFEWQVQQGDDATLSGETIKRAAAILWHKIPEYQDQPVPNFSNGWLEGFRKRHILHAINEQPTESVVLNNTEPPNDPLSRVYDVTRLTNINDIFTMQETGLFWKLVPNGTPEVEDIKGITRFKARITLTVCCNASGTERLPLWVIGYSQSPRVFRAANVKPEVMNFKWRSNGKASMTTAIMEEWLRWFDACMEGRKVILLIDSYTPHLRAVENIRNSGNDLRNTTVITLPSTSASISQPCSEGVIYALKACYRKHWVQYILEQNELGRNPYNTTNVLRAILWLVKAWTTDISPEIIENAFNLSGVLGLFNESAVTSRALDEMIHPLRELVSEFSVQAAMRIEDFISPSEENIVDSSEDIINQIASQYMDDRAFETDEEESTEFQITTKDAMKAIELLLNYEAQQPDGNPAITISLLNYQKLLEARGGNVNLSRLRST